MKERIESAVERALTEASAAGIRFVVEYPAQLAQGDFATNAALVAASALGKNPRVLAQKLADSIQETLTNDWAQVSVAGPGFVNISLTPRALTPLLEEMATDAQVRREQKIQQEKRVFIEYGNPNPFKEMHIGHLVGAVLGEALSRLIENSGATVARDTFGGDVGPHVAKALWGLAQARIKEPSTAAEIGKAYAHGSRAYEESEKAREEIDQLNVSLYRVVSLQDHPEKLSAHERALLETWRRGRDVSMEEFERLYRLLGTHFDYTFYDSDTIDIGLRVVQDGVAAGIFEKSEGALVYRGEKKGLHTLVFVTSRGTPTYETKDIGLAFLKEERWASNQSLVITSAEQKGHFAVVRAALEDIAPLLAKKTVHIAHGTLRLTTGKMSSREGNIITAARFLEDVIRRAREKNADPIIAEQVAVGAVKYMILRQSPGADIIFDPVQSLSLEGDSGPYLQYALVRARSVLRTAKGEGRESASAEAASAMPPKPYEFARLLVRFPDVVARAQMMLAPNILATYLTELAGTWNSFYAKERIIGGEHEAHKIVLVHAFTRAMQKGLTLLGIPAPEKM